MTKDPAFTSEHDTDQFTPLAAVPRDPNAVYLFDFDGVVASGTEDQIYKLHERRGEREMFARIEDRLSLRIRQMDMRYRRHLLFQELAAEHSLEMAKGPGFALAKWASDHARFFVLTARSGWAATARARDFLRHHQLKPIDLYQVGRVHKDRQVLRTVEEFAAATVFYIEDAPAHLARSAALKLASLTPVYCAASIDLADVEALYQKVFGPDLKHE